MNGYELAYSLSCCRACVSRCLYCTDIASYHDSNETAAYEFLAD